MVLCVKVILNEAEAVKRYLVEHDLFSSNFSFKKEGAYIFFPIAKKGSLASRFKDIGFVERIDLRPARKNVNLKEAVSDQLSKDELSVLRRAFDVVGSIAILEIPAELASKEKLLAETILKLHKNVSTVVKKAGVHGTEFRTQPMQYLAGIDTKETIHKECGIQLKLDVEQVYFSPRLSTERERVAKDVKSGESVLVMFSGCAPYPCVMAKNSKAKDVVGIELNPVGHKYGLENILLNKLKNVTLMNGDARDAYKLTKRKFDRVVMPLPKSSGDFLEAAFAVSKPGTVVNFYAFEEEGKFDAAHKRILAACEKNKLRCEIIKTVKCGQQSPGVFRVCVDFRLL